MAYEKMLDKILEQHKQNEDISKKVYRYTGLVHAIEFFSQKFNLGHVEDYIYAFTNELLLPDQIALFVKKGAKYKLKHVHGYEQSDCIFYDDKSYDELIYYHSGLLTNEKIEDYFPKEVLENYPALIAIPLIMDRDLYGIIFLNRLQDTFADDDFIIANALMNLYAAALTNHKNYDDLLDMSKQLNEKLFNLFAINHSSKALLSQLDLSTLYELSISAFSELTQSSFTTFFLYDELTESYRLMSLKDVYNSKLIMFINLYPTRPIDDIQVGTLTDMNDLDQRQAFFKLFKKANEKLQDIKAQYIVSIKKDQRLIGFVTLGPKTNNNPYEKSIFELIESLASSTYIAISNARNFHQIMKQKEVMNNKLNRIVQLNVLMKHINGAKSSDQLLELTLSTMSVLFGVTSGFIALYHQEENTLTIQESIHINGDLKTIPMVQDFEPLKKGENIIYNSEADVERIFPSHVVEAFEGNYSGAIMVPIFVEDNELKLLGVIGILAIRDKILGDEENITTLEFIASHIASVLYQFYTLQQVIDQYKPDYQVLLLQDLKKGIVEAKEFKMAFKVVHICLSQTYQFQRVSLDELGALYKRIYPVDNANIFVFACDQHPIQNISHVLGDDVIYRQYELGRDFNTVDEFLQHFNEA
ncbi:GAF domain-containing protein [Vallitalea pronyensis]|uniref:GAF domain-containing protein n=1 Tax=Vallitalea pronyensis TaxID=1348613 RepID=A0A8J8MP76_9FIRM|nr:GAF domain-containing protein [Vallitalea pronyensis]QUI25069.1 GAF domain-containing protein [Vallitalea pronyensis]